MAAHGAGVAAVDARLAGQDLAAHDAGFDLEQQAVDFHAVEGALPSAVRASLTLA